MVPPYILKELLKQDPKNKDLQYTYNQTNLLLEQPFAVSHADGPDEHGEREVYDAKQRRIQPGDKARFESEPPTGIDDVDKAYDFTGIVRDFYQKEFGRNSIDGDGMKLIS